MDRRSFVKAGAAGLALGPLACTPIDETPSFADQGLDLGTRIDPWVEVEASALYHNVGEVRRLSGDRPILAVVKNNAYGLDVVKTAQLLEPMPEIGGFAVVKAEAAIALSDAGISKPIVLMALFPESLAPELANRGIQPSLYTENAPQLAAAMSGAIGGPVAAHLYLDTGMSRMGVPYTSAVERAAAIVAGGARLRSVFTGFTEEPEFDREQLRRFEHAADELDAADIRIDARHAASSSAVFELPESHLDWVRPGIALYGGYPNDPSLQREAADLRPAFRLKARVVRVEQLQAGDSVSYGRNYVADAPTWVATIPAGHTDGVPRVAVDGGRVLVGERTYPVIGAVSASHTIIEVGSDKTVAVGDLATLIGPDHPDIDPNRLSEVTGASVYDVFMHLNPSIPRVVV